MCGQGSELARGMPAESGLLLGAAVSPDTADHTVILESLILLGVKYLKKQGSEVILLQAGSMIQPPSLDGWGFASVQRFEYVSAMHSIEPM